MSNATDNLSLRRNLDALQERVAQLENGKPNVRVGETADMTYVKVHPWNATESQREELSLVIRNVLEDDGLSSGELECMAAQIRNLQELVAILASAVFDGDPKEQIEAFLDKSSAYRAIIF